LLWCDGIVEMRTVIGGVEGVVAGAVEVLENFGQKSLFA
jgi:hypothetical protein